MSAGSSAHRLVFRYVYALAAVSAFAAIFIVTALYLGKRAEDRARDRVTLYNLASAVELGQLQRELRTYERLMRGQAASGGPAASDAGPAQILLSSPAASLYSLRSRMGRLDELQDQYAGEEFVATLGRLSQRFVALESLLETPDRRPEFIASITAIQLNAEQLLRLHQIAAAQTLASIEDRAGGLLRNLALFALVLMTAVATAWYLMRLLKLALAREKEAEEELAASRERIHHMQKLEALGQLVGGVAHDFNNLLTAILGQAGLLRKQTSGNARLQSGVNEISEAAQQASSLTNQLLAFSRRQPIAPRAADLNELVRSMEPMLRRLIGEDIALTFRYDDDLDTVKADPGQMHQVVLNLLVNARDAIPDSGSISLATENVQFGPHDPKPDDLQPGRYARLVVTDDGVGMDKETLDRMFEPFFTTKPKGRGTGLGLSTVHGIVQAADGHILATSRPGAGTRFEIYLPGIEGQTEPIASEPPAEDQYSGSETVLVVEDEAQIRTLLREGLGMLGYRVLTAAGGTKGLEVCASEPAGIDVILSDVVMPDMNGAEFIKAALPVQPNAAVIYMSGYTDEVVLQRGVDESEFPLIHKPFEVDELARIMREQLEVRRAPAARASGGPA